MFVSEKRPLKGGISRQGIAESGLIIHRHSQSKVFFFLPMQFHMVVEIVVQSKSKSRETEISSKIVVISRKSSAPEL